MGEGTTVRSPWSLDKTDPHPRRGESPGANSSPSSAPRNDGGHIANHIGKGLRPPSRWDNGEPTLDMPPTNRVVPPVNDSRR
jgi:hypothetical protein